MLRAELFWGSALSFSDTMVACHVGTELKIARSQGVKINTGEMVSAKRTLRELDAMAIQQNLTISGNIRPRRFVKPS